MHEDDEDLMDFKTAFLKPQIFKKQLKFKKVSTFCVLCFQISYFPNTFHIKSKKFTFNYISKITKWFFSKVSKT